MGEFCQKIRFIDHEIAIMHILLKVNV